MLNIIEAEIKIYDEKIDEIDQIRRLGAIVDSGLIAQYVCAKQTLEILKIKVMTQKYMVQA